MKKRLVPLYTAVIVLLCPVLVLASGRKEDDLSAPGLKRPPVISGNMPDFGTEDSDDGTELPPSSDLPEDITVKPTDIPDDKTDKEPEDGAETKPGDEQETEPEDTPETEPEDTPETEPDDGQETGPEDTPDTKPENEPGRKRVHKPGDKPAKKAEEPSADDSEPGDKPDKDAESVSGNETDQKTDKQDDVPQEVSGNGTQTQVTAPVQTDASGRWYENMDHQLMALSGLAVAGLLIIMFVWRSRSRKKTADVPEATDRQDVSPDPRTDPPVTETIERTPITDPAPGDVELTVKMIEGTLKNDSTVFYLRKDIVIGSDGVQCEIALDGTGVSPRHARIYVTEGHLFIEDLNSDGGTFVGGMRIYAPNRVRNGDEIGIGEAGFTIGFKSYDPG
ncbi:MAG: FHA domain-containing protein [Lachnospiraceae bacterium]|nr:FHA domain-containing protein [Lachnospiraceae bacterium]